jgi:F-type H+-transporting ATPase subunit epsilon
MKLTVATPLATVVEADDVAHLRAEDATGAFGVLPGHADFLTALAISVVSWRGREESGRAGGERHVAVRGGMLQVRDGDTIAIATREAVPGDDLVQLERDVLSRFREAQASEAAARLDAQRLYLAAIRRIVGLVRPQRSGGGADGAPLRAQRDDGLPPDGSLSDGAMPNGGMP